MANDSWIVKQSVAGGVGSMGGASQLGASGVGIYPHTTFPSPFGLTAYDIYKQGIHGVPVIGFVGDFRVRKLENGYIIEYALTQNGSKQEYYAEGLREVGERITAICVQDALKGEKK